MLLLGNRSLLVFCVVVSTVPSNKRIKRLKLSRGVDLNYFPTGIVWWDHGPYPFGPTFSWKRVSFSSRFNHDSTNRRFSLVSLTRSLAFKRCLLSGTNLKKTLFYEVWDVI